MDERPLPTRQMQEASCDSRLIPESFRLAASCRCSQCLAVSRRRKWITSHCMPLRGSRNRVRHVMTPRPPPRCRKYLADFRCWNSKNMSSRMSSRRNAAIGTWRRSNSARPNSRQRRLSKDLCLPPPQTNSSPGLRPIRVKNPIRSLALLPSTQVSYRASNYSMR